MENFYKLFQGAHKIAFSMGLIIIAIGVAGSSVLIAYHAIKNNPINAPVRLITEDEATVNGLNQILTKKKYDSLVKTIERKENDKNDNYKNDISRACVRLQESLNNCIHVTYWKVHNNGQPIDIESKAYFMVMLSSSDNLELDYKKDQELPEGYFNFAKEVVSRPLYLVDDVRTNGAIYYDADTKSRLELMGTVSMMGASVKRTKYEWLIVTFSFSKIYPESFNPNLKITLLDFRRYVQKRL